MKQLKNNWLTVVLSTIVSFVALLLVSAFNDRSYSPVIVTSNVTRSLNTSYQPNTQRETICVYNIRITSNAVVLTGSRMEVFFETSPNNSTWTAMGDGEYGVNSGVLITSAGTVTISGWVPKGYYFRIRTNNVFGTPTAATAKGYDISLN